jgi:2-oxoglutarate ferredoxin oxidoreductase subunit alpha
MKHSLNIMVGGEAGQGVQSVGFILSKTFARGGYNIFADQDYESRIRGGHNFFRIRVQESEVGAISEALDMLLALNRESIDLHRKELAKGGLIIFDEKAANGITTSRNMFGMPLEKLAIEAGGNKVMANTAGLGALLGAVGYDFKILEQVLKEHFDTVEIGEGNVKAAKAGYDYLRDNYKGEFSLDFDKTGEGKRMLLTGNEAIALGAIAAGCKFMAAYPMTPASSIMEYLAAHGEEFGVTVVQAEDEIAAINMINGAGYAGVRAMTATSGGGFCLMVEGLGLAGMTETPIVVINAQRPGPAIGLPTRTEQGDLEFMLYASHGEFPRAVLAPTTIEDCFWLTIRAFNLADQYQTPVIMITDQHLASSYSTIKKFDLSKVTIDRGLLVPDNEAANDYKRHRITKSGITPRAFPGREDLLVVTDSDEHDEAGHLIEDANTRTKMVQKRMKKLEGLKHEMPVPVTAGPHKADNLLIGWGSTFGAIAEAAEILDEEGYSVSSLQLKGVWPFPIEPVTNSLKNANFSFVVENNATGQLAHLIKAETGIGVDAKILKYSGRPFTPAEIVDQVKKEGLRHGKS